MRFKKVLIFLLVVFVAALILRFELIESTINFADLLINYAFYSQVIEKEEELFLSENEVLLIKDALYIQKDNIILRDNAKLIIEDSYFRLPNPHPLAFKLEARDNSQVIIRNSKLKVDDWIEWSFHDTSRLIIENSNTNSFHAWIVCGDDSECSITNTSIFKGTVTDRALLSINNVSEIFIEISLQDVAIVKESFPSRIDFYEFPSKNDLGIPFKLKVKNVDYARWGITLEGPSAEVTIRNTESLTVGIHFRPPYYNNSRLEFEGLKSKLYEDESWALGDFKLRLINTKVSNWFIYAGGENVITIRNSDLADANLNSGRAKIYLERVTIGVIRGLDEVEITVKDSEVHDEIIAEGNSKIILINTKVHDDIIEKDKGKVIIK